MNEELRLLLYVLQVALGSLALAPLFLALQPQRHAGAAAQLANGFVGNLLVGLLPLGAALAGLVALGAAGLRTGYLALLVATGLLCSLGIGVAGRALGQRLLADAAPLRQTLVGAAMLCGGLLWPAAGLVLFVVATALGIGAWLRAGR